MIKLWKLSAYICYNLVLFTAHNTSRCLCFGYMWISRLPLLRLNISTASCLWIESTHLGKEISWFCSWLHRACIKSLPPGWVCTDLLPVLALWCVLRGRTYGHEVCTTFYELESLKAHLSTASQSCNRFWNAVWLYQGQYSAMVLSFVLEMVQNATVHFPRS